MHSAITQMKQPEVWGFSSFVVDFFFFFLTFCREGVIRATLINILLGLDVSTGRQIRILILPQSFVNEGHSQNDTTDNLS